VEKIAPSRHGLLAMTAWEIVGVVADEKATAWTNSRRGCLRQLRQDPVIGLGLVARGAGDPGALIKSIQRAFGDSTRTRCSTTR